MEETMMMRHKPAVKAIALTVVMTFFAMGCRSSGSTGDDQSGIRAVGPGDTATATATVPAPGPGTDTATATDAETCPEVFDFDDETCDDGGGSTGTGTVKTQSVPGEGASTLNDVPCTPRYSDCVSKCNDNMAKSHDNLVKLIFGADAAIVGGIAAIAVGFKAALLKACTTLSWKQILTRAGVAAAIITAAILLLDAAAWAAGAIPIKSDYKKCVADCGDPSK
jgi:hypothetical protein